MTRKEFTTIDPAALELVSGGRRTSTSASSDSDDRILDAIDSLKDAISDLGRNQQKSSSSGLEQLLPMLMMQMMGGLGGTGGTGGCSGSGTGCGGGRY